MHDSHCQFMCYCTSLHQQAYCTGHILEAGFKVPVYTTIYILLLTTLTSGPNFCMIVAENAAPANNRR